MINTIVVGVISRHGEIVETLIPLNRLVGANENTSGDVWLTYIDDARGNERKCRVSESVRELNYLCNNTQYWIGENKQDTQHPPTRVPT